MGLKLSISSPVFTDHAVILTNHPTDYRTKNSIAGGIAYVVTF